MGQQGYLRARLCLCAQGATNSEAVSKNCDFSGSLLSTPHRLAAVYTTRAKITSIINKTQSTISLFQSSLVPHLSVNELRFRHRYQRHSMFNYSYRACSFCHCCLASLLPSSFFFFWLLRNPVYMQLGGVVNDSLAEPGRMFVLVVQNLLDHARRRRRNFKPRIITQRERCACILVQNILGSRLGPYQLCKYFHTLLKYERSDEVQL